jgi:6-phosphogluconolactonase (cycloisomerase 2 family)
MKPGMRTVRSRSREQRGRWRSRRTSIGVGLALGVLLAASSPNAAVLEFLEFYLNGSGGASGLNGIRGVTVSPDGAHLYAASSVYNSVAVFEREGTTGLLTFVEVERDGVDGLDGAYLAKVSPDGAHVYVAAYDDDAVTVFERDAATGALTFVELQRDGDPGVDGLDGATAVAVSPDGDHVYVGGTLEDALVVFDRNPSTGALSFVELHRDGVGGVDGLDSPRSVVVSPDGADVYVASNVDDAVAVFNRNDSTGALSFAEVHKDGQNGVDGLNGITEVAVSPDNADVYGASFSDSSVPVFSRDALTGELSFTEFQRDNLGGVDGLGGALSVAVSPDGKRVFAGSANDDAVAAFDRDAATGALTFVEFQKDGVGGVDGLEGVNRIAISPDGGHLYVGAFTEGAVAVFAVPEPTAGILQVAALAAITALAIRSAAQRPPRASAVSRVQPDAPVASEAAG